MEIGFWNMVYDVIATTLIVYGAAVAVGYLSGVFLSLLSLRKYTNKNYFVDYKYILSSPFAPGVSLMATTFNENLTIVDRIKALLAVQYNNLEVIMINDGSSDDTLERITRAFDLVEFESDFQNHVSTKQWRRIYRSANNAFKKLLELYKTKDG